MAKSFKEGVEVAMGFPDAQAIAKSAGASFVMRFPSGSGWVLVPTKSLVPSPTNPRSKLGDVGELVASIEKVGLLQPLLVRQLPDTMKFEVVFGHRRLKAAQEAGLKSVPCDVRELTDVQVLEAQVVENCQREDIDPLDEAEAYERLQKAAGYTGDQIAARVGKSRAAVYARLKLNALGPEGRKALRAGLIHPSVAVPLARVPTHALQAKAVTYLTKGDEPLKASAAITYLQDEFAQSLKGCPFLKDDMLTDAGPCTTCPKNSATATPGLFEDLASGAWCTDTKCYAEKSKAHWEKKSEKAEAQNAVALSLTEGRKLFKDSDGLAHGTPFVLADEPVTQDSKRRTWRELVEKLEPSERPQVYVAPDGKLKAVDMYKRADAEKAIAEGLQLKWAEQAVKHDEVSAERAKPEATLEAKLMNDVRTRVRNELIARATANATAPAYRLKAFGFISRALAADMDSAPYFEAKDTTLEKWVAKANETECLEFIFWAAMTVATNGLWDGYPEELLELAKAFGFDIEAMTAATLATVQQEAKS